MKRSLLLIVLVCAAQAQAADPPVSSEVQIQALRDQVGAMRATIDRQAKEIARLQDLLKVACGPATAPTSQPTTDVRRQDAKDRYARMMKDRKGQGWFEKIELGAVGYFSGADPAIVKVVNATTAIVQVQTIQEYATAVNNMPRTGQSRDWATVLMKGVDTSKWADGQKVKINGAFWISEIETLRGTRYLVAESLEDPPPAARP